MFPEWKVSVSHLHLNCDKLESFFLNKYLYMYIINTDFSLLPCAIPDSLLC